MAKIDIDDKEKKQEQAEDQAPEDTGAEEKAEDKEETVKDAGEAPEASEKKEPEEDGDTRYLRLMADFQNYKKRVEKEKTDLYSYANEKLITEMLDVIDNFERGLLAVAEEDKESPFVQGMELVYKQMLTAFDALGVKPIDAVGKEFDPNLHNAVMMVDDDALESGTVAEEMQKGYMYKDSVVRHSMVKVVN